MDEFDPDKAPPAKTAEEFAKEEINSAKNAVAVMLLLGFAACGSVHLFSRRLATNSLSLHAGQLLGALLPAVVYQGRVEATGAHDAVRFELLLLALVGIWLAATVVHLFRRGSTPTCQIEFGDSILSPLLPSKAAGFLGDLAVAASLSLLFYGFASPIQGDYFLGLMTWLVFCHGWVFARRLLHQARRDAAVKRATNWRQNLRRRHL